MRVLILILLVSSTTLGVVDKSPTQTSDDRLSPGESQEVEQFVRTFSKRLKLTRDLSPFLTEPPARTVLDKVMLDKDDSLPPISRELISGSNLTELRRFWIATLNLAYLSELYVYTKVSVKGLRTYEMPPEQQYPPNVARLMKRNPMLSQWWKQYDSDSSEQIVKTVDQLRSFISTFQEAASLMRTRFQGASARTDRAVSEKHRLLVRVLEGCGR